MKHTLAVTSAVVVVSTAVSAIVNLKDSCRSIYSWQEKGAFSRFLGSSPACVQSWDAEREMVPRRLRFSLELVENSPSLECCELIRAHDWPISDKGSYHWINTLSVSARCRAYLASGWWLACCFKALHWRIRVLSSPSHHLMFDVANYTLTSVYVSRSLSKEKQSSQFVFFIPSDYNEERIGWRKVRGTRALWAESFVSAFHPTEKWYQITLKKKRDAENLSATPPFYI